MLEKHPYTCTLIFECKYLQNKRHTGVVLVSRCGCLSSVNLSAYFLQTNSTNTPDLERIAV